MNRTLTIAKREFRGYFNSPSAYIVICLFLLVLGLFFWTPFFFQGRASVRGMFDWMSRLMVVTAPALTMGLIAEEKRAGTIEILLTMPVRDAEVIIGKYLAALGVLAVLLLCTIVYPLSAASLGNLDWGPVWTGYFALLLQGGAMLAIGVLASSWTENQLIAFFTSMMICFGLFVVDAFLAFIQPPALASVVEWVSFNYHFQDMARGVIDTRNLFYFLSVIGFSLALAFRSLDSRRWS